MAHHNELAQQARAGFTGVGADRYDDLRRACQQEADLAGDHRYVVLERCCRVSSNCWTEGEAGVIYTNSATELSAIWDTHIADIIAESDPALARGLANILLDDLLAFIAALKRP